MHIACILLRLILSHFVITHCSCSIPEWTCNYTWLTYPWITRVRCNLVKESSQLRWCMGETSMPLRQRMAREAVFTGECCSCAHFRPCLFHVSHLSISFSDLCRWWTLPPPLFPPLLAVNGCSAAPVDVVVCGFDFSLERLSLSRRCTCLSAIKHLQSVTSFNKLL